MVYSRGYEVFISGICLKKPHFTALGIDFTTFFLPRQCISLEYPLIFSSGFPKAWLFLPDFFAHSAIFQGKILFLYILTDSGPELREKIRRLRIVFFSVREYNADVF